MREFQTVYKDRQQFEKEILSWKQDCTDRGFNQIVFHLFSNGAKEEDVQDACRIIERVMPQADYIGSAASGSIFKGEVTELPLVISAVVMERPGSFLRTRQFEIEHMDTEAFEQALSDFQDDMTGVKAVELIATIDSIPIRKVCSLLEKYLPEDVPVFGGGAFGDNTHDAYTFVRGGARSKNSLIMLLFGGDEFRIFNTYVMGWKPLGAPLRVTKACQKVLYELDDEPAFRTYEHYLRIPNDENLFYNALEFPFAVSKGDRVVLRHALSCDDNGALTMSTDIPNGSELQLTYGDPETILENVRSSSRSIASFCPEVTAVFDCFGRKTFWGNNAEASKETTPFYETAMTYGFCTAGEFVRRKNTGVEIDHHNLSLVVAGMREGTPDLEASSEKREDQKQSDTTMSLVKRLANYINTAKAELVEANNTLSILAVTDRLTSLFNRGEIQRRISERINECMSAPEKENATSLVMIDLDNFKGINDTYGHAVGDEVLIRISGLIRRFVEKPDVQGVAGRWGGEEFMIMLPGFSQQEAAEFADRLREEVAALPFDFGRETASFGVAQAGKGEKPDPLASRVDAALYEAKRSGKNKVVQAGIFTASKND